MRVCVNECVSGQNLKKKLYKEKKKETGNIKYIEKRNTDYLESRGQAKLWKQKRCVQIPLIH